MKTVPVPILAGLLLLAGATGASVMAKDLSTTTLRVQNGGSTATITQSGPSGASHRSVARGSGYTRIEQRSGASRAFILQGDGFGAASADADDGAAMSPLKPRSATARRANADVYGAVRERSSPRSQANLDRLMDMLGFGRR